MPGQTYTTWAATKILCRCSGPMSGCGHFLFSARRPPRGMGCSGDEMSLPDSDFYIPHWTTLFIIVMLRLQRRILDGLLKGSQRQGYLFGTQKTAVKEHSNDHHDHHDHHEHDSHDDHDDHHHHDKPYDWRDDFAQNLEY